MVVAKSDGAVEYTGCNSIRGKTPPRATTKEWWASSLGDLESVKYQFIAINPRSILIQSDSIL